MPIWVDEIPATAQPDMDVTKGAGEEGTGTETGAQQWKTEFSGAEARVVRDAIGGVVICLRNLRPGHDRENDAEREDVRSLKEFLRCIGDVKRLVEEERAGNDDHGEGDGGLGFGEVLGLIILVEDGDKNKKEEKKKTADIEAEEGLEEMGEPFSVSWWEDQLDDIGLMDFDIVSWDPNAPDTDFRDKYGGMSFPLSDLMLHTNCHRVPRNAPNPPDHRNVRLGF